MPGPATDRASDLLDGAPAGVATFADDGTITFANQTLADMLGYPRAELEGRRMESLMGMGARIFYQTHFFPLVRMHGRADEVFLLLRASGGEEVGVLANAVRLERPHGTENQCVFMEVRERRRFEDELLRARRDAEHARALAEERAEALGAANEQMEEQALELELQHHQLQEQAAELEAQSEEMRSINDILIDRTVELERQRAAAEEANRAKSTFLAVMSHELRTPLNAIAGYVQLLEMGIHGPISEPQREALVRIDRSQAHLLRLINDVLNLARIESGRVDYVLDEVPVRELLSAVAPMVEPQMDGKGLAFRVDVGSVPPVLVDREKVQQILINLLGNAVKFTPEGGRVTVDAVPGDDERQVRVRVRDTGIGIPPGKRAAVFEPFVQVDTSRTRRSEGTGLGLAISRDLARGMGGELAVESREGHGSTFTLTLPAAGGPS